MGKALFADLHARKNRSLTTFLALLGFSIPCIPWSASALPLFARQTGQACAACHNGYPELTPYGRLFKLNGYTFTGGTPGTGSPSNLPPVSMMVLSSFNNTQAGQSGGAATHFGDNSDLAVDQVSLFTGGAMAPNLGSFVQVTYDGIKEQLHWDNLDVRYARSFSVFGREVVSGISVNNNPTVQDVWNTTPAWRFPYVNSALAPTPAASTLLDGSFAQQVLGATAYALWDRMIYVEAGGYDTLSTRFNQADGAGSGNDTLKTIAPYWRVALQGENGRHSYSVGTFGLTASKYPGGSTSNGTDDYVDLGFDAQYEFLGDRDSFSLQASDIHESQTLNASLAAGNSNNLHDTLNSVKVKGTYGYDQTYYGSLGYFQITGSEDTGLYTNSANNSPNSAGLIGEVDYMPFNHGGPGLWPWLNAKIGLQYTYYTEFNGGTKNFDGNGRNATDNNTLYLFTWFAF